MLQKGFRVVKHAPHHAPRVHKLWLSRDSKHIWRAYRVVLQILPSSGRREHNPQNTFWGRARARRSRWRTSRCVFFLATEAREKSLRPGPFFSSDLDPRVSYETYTRRWQPAKDTGPPQARFRVGDIHIVLSYPRDLCGVEGASFQKPRKRERERESTRGVEGVSAGVPKRKALSKEYSLLLRV